MRAVAQHRHAFLGDGGKHQLARRAVRQGLFGGGVDNLGDDVILIDVHAVLFQALESHARAANFGQAVDIQRVDAKQFLNALTHFLRPRLGAEAAGPELEFRQGDARIADGLAQIQRIGRRAAQHGDAQFLNHHNLTLGVAAGHGNDRCAQPSRALMRAKAAGEQAVTICNLHDIVRAAASGGDGARHQFRPYLHIVLGIAGYDGAARGAAGALDAHNVVQRRGQQPIGELIAQIRFFHKRQVFQVFNAVNVLGTDTLGVHARAVDRHIVVFVLDRPTEPFRLERAAFIAAHGLHFRVEHIVFLGCGQAQHPLRSKSGVIILPQR